jgi:acyl-coenzyme A thioesterase PaaI-like protein
LHSRVTATLLDQVIGILVLLSYKSRCATAELTVKYKRPVITPAVLLYQASIVREARRWIELVR